MESMPRTLRAVKSICERDPQWWAQRRSKLDEAHRLMAEAAAMLPMTILKRQPLDCDLTGHQLPETEAPRPVVLRRLGGGRRLINSVFAGRKH